MCWCGRLNVADVDACNGSPKCYLNLDRCRGANRGNNKKNMAWIIIDRVACDGTSLSVPRTRTFFHGSTLTARRASHGAKRLRLRLAPCASGWPSETPDARVPSRT